jgi:hypothetical protein
MVRVSTVPFSTGKNKRDPKFFELLQIIVLIINVGYLTRP